MSVFIDLLVREKLNEHLLSIGNISASGNINERVLNLSSLGIPSVVGERNIQIVAGETPPPMLQDHSWVEAFMVKAPQFIRTPSEQGISQKLYMYTLWIKTDKELGLFDNEAISGLIEQHFPNNLHLPIGNDVITILKTYQQPTVIADNETGRLFNRVFIDCEVYYKNNN